MSNRQLNFMDLYIARTITPDDPIKRIFDAIDWQSMAKFKPPKKSKKGRKGIEIAIDGTHLCAQPHDPEASWGFKRQTFSFFGYKVILLVSVKEPIFPIAVEVVPGNAGESPEFRKVIDQFTHYHPAVKVKKVFGDAAFDSNENFKKVIDDLAAKPYIAINTRGKENSFLTENVYFDEEGHLCCLSGRRLVYWGQEKKRRRVKYRCPIAVSGGDCLFAPLCNRSKYGRSFYMGKDGEYRLQGIAASGKRSGKKEYAKKRARIEAENGILKNNLRMKNFYFRRLVKVRLFVLLCCLGEVGRRLGQVKETKDSGRLRKSA